MKLTVFALIFLLYRVNGIKILGVLPSNGESSSEEPTPIDGNTPITMIFSEAVIELGGDWSLDGKMPAQTNPFKLYCGTDLCNISGTTRWLNTYTARFDPAHYWPTDLSFSVTVDQTLQPWDKSQVPDVSYRFKTPKMNPTLSSIKSNEMDIATGGSWNAFMLMDGMNPEVVPDAIVEIDLRVPANLQFCKNGIVMVSEDGNTRVPIIISACASGENTCIHVTIDSERDPEFRTRTNMQYNIIFQKNNRFCDECGNLKQDAIIKVSGPYAFSFPFLKFGKDEKAEHNNFRLYVRHGLRNPGTVGLFKNAITVSTSSGDKIEYSVNMPDLYTLEIYMPLLNKKQYEVNVKQDDEIIDGLGLPLQAGKVVVKMKDWAKYRTLPAILIVQFEKPVDFSWLAFVQNTNVTIQSASITPSNVKRILPVAYNWDHPFSSFDGPHATSADMSSGEKTIGINLEPLLGGGGKAAYIHTVTLEEYSQTMTQLIVASNMTASFFSPKKDTLTAWVVFTDGRGPVVNAVVTVYSGGNPATAIGHCVTNSDGLCSLSVPSTINQWQTTATIEYSGNRDSDLLITDVGWINYIQAPQDGIIATAVTDRALYKPGDTALVSVYAREILSGQVPNKNIAPILSMGFHEDGKQEVKIAMTYDERSGNAVAEIPVPLDAKFTTHYFNIIDKNSNLYLTSGNLYVGDPRPPTVKLSLDSPQHSFNPAKGIDLNLSTQTYLGTPAGHSKLNVVWTLSDPVLDWTFGCYFLEMGMNFYRNSRLTTSPESSMQGEIELYTDEFGKLFYNLLPSFTSPPKPGSTFTVKVEWVGPTGELLQASLSRKVSISEWAIEMQANGMQIPGYPFQLRLGLTDLLNDQEIPGKSIRINLYDWNDSIVYNKEDGTVTGLPSSSVGSCEALSGKKTDLQCSFTLPTIGLYLLVATTKESPNQGSAPVTVLVVGKTQEEWDNAPLNSLSLLPLVSDKDVYRVNEKAVFSFYSPFPKASALVAVVHSTGDKESITISELQQGMNEITAHLKKEVCDRGCGVVIIICAPRQEGVKLPVDVPVSVLFDISAPTTITSAHSIVVANEDFESAVSLNTPSISAPSSSITIGINADGIPEGEATIYVVNSAILDLMPLPLQILKDSLIVSRSIYPSVKTSNTELSTKKAYLKSAQIYEERLKKDPWYAVQSWTIRTTPYRDSVDIPFDEWKETVYSDITEHPFNSYDNGLYEYAAMEKSAQGGQFELSPQLAMLDAGNQAQVASNSAPPPTQSSVQFRKDFESAPYHKFKVPIINGRASVSFNGPSDVGEYTVRAYVSESKANGKKLGQAESKIVVRTETVNLKTNMPRIVRIGDVWASGVTITCVNDIPDVLVQLSVDCSLLSSKTITQRANCVSTSPTEVLFEMKAAGYGIAKYTFEAYVDVTNEKPVAGRRLDAVAGSLDILGVMPKVFVASSVAIKATEDGKVWNEKLKIPSAVPGSGEMDLHVSVGQYALVKSLVSRNLVDTVDQDDTGRSPNRWLKIAPSYAAMSLYPPDPDLASHLDNKLNSALNHLAAYTTPFSGLRWCLTCNDEYQSVSVYLNAMGVYLFSYPQVQLKLTAKNKEMIGVWKNAIEKGISYEVENNQYPECDSLALVYLALGTAYKPSDTRLTFQYIKDHYQTCSNKGVAMILMSMMAREEVDSKQYKDITSYLENKIKIQERTAYLSYDSNSDYADRDGTMWMIQALAVKLQEEETTSLEESILPKLVNFLGQSPNHQDYYYYYEFDTGVAAISLSQYDLIVGNSKPKLSFTATVAQNHKAIYQREFRGADSGQASDVFYSFDELLGDEISFVAKGSGEVYTVAGFNFIPSSYSTEDISRGIRVNKVIRNIDPITKKPIGPPISYAPRGTEVAITLQITTNDYYRDVQLFDPLPGGLEALDSNIYSINNEATTEYPGYSCRGTCWFYAWFYSPFSALEFRKDGVASMAYYLPAGSVEVTYHALSVTRGEFVLPPAKLWVSNSPEAMGLSKTASFRTIESPITHDLDAPVESNCLSHENVSAYKVFYGTRLTGESSKAYADNTPDNYSGLTLIAAVLVAAVAFIALIAFVVIGVFIWKAKSKKDLKYQKQMEISADDDDQFL